MSNLRTLVLDIETSPLVVMVWELGKQYVTLENLLKDWHVMAFTAKWVDDPASKLIYMETRNEDDLPLLKKLRELFDEADVVVTQNGKGFDEPKIRARMMLKGLTPYKPFKHHDTFLENKDKHFTSHKLEYLTEKFCTKYKKLKHKAFPGMSLWKECMGMKFSLNPNPKAWAEMRKYNNHDVLSTGELYLNTRGWSTSKAPKIVESEDISKCKYCESGTCIKRGKEVTLRATYQRLQCQSCGKWQRGESIKKELDR